MRVKIIIENDNGEESVATYIEDLGEGSKKTLIEMLSLQSKVKKTYSTTYDGDPYQMTGEFRAPNKGEFYLSGANPLVYQAFNDLDTEYNICVKI